MSLRLGIIAEDQSDLEVLHVLATKISRRQFSVSHFLGRGCGTIRRKARPWCENLASKGCTHIAVVHDKDRSDAQVLRATLEALLPRTAHVKTSIIIPTEEIEAWLLSDTAAISRVLHLQKALPSVNHPERLVSPKEHLVSLVRKCSAKRKVYLTTVHNRIVAREMSIETATRKCPSFCDFQNFVLAATR